MSSTLIIYDTMKKLKFLGLLISILIFIAIILYINPVEIFAVISKSDPKYLILSFIISNLALLVRVAKWWVLLEGISLKEIIPVQVLGITISNLTPGKAGEPIKSVILKIWKKMPVSSTLPTVIWERVIDIIILVILGFVGISLIVNKYMIFGLISIGFFILLIMLLILGLYSKSFGLKVFRLFKRILPLNKIDEGFVDAFYESKIKSKKLVMCLIITAIAWFLDGLTFYFVLLSFSSSAAGPFVISCILALSILISLLSMLPGGIGGTEAIMILLLISIGIESAISASVVILGRFITFGYSMFLGYLSFLYFSKRIELKSIMRRAGF